MPFDGCGSEAGAGELSDSVGFRGGMAGNGFEKMGTCSSTGARTGGSATNERMGASASNERILAGGTSGTSPAAGAVVALGRTPAAPSS